jgi:hypothetical protein
VRARSTTLEIVEDAFCCFDASADGYLERAEVEAAMGRGGASTPGRCALGLGSRGTRCESYGGALRRDR